MFAMLGDVRFELLGSFTDLEETHGASYAKHEVLAGRPRLQAMGKHPAPQTTGNIHFQHRHALWRYPFQPFIQAHSKSGAALQIP